MKLKCTFAVLFVLILTFPLLAQAEIARVEIRPFQSVTLSDTEFLTGQNIGKSVTIAGELRIPKQGTDRLPVVVMLHGSGGIGGFVDDWVNWFNERGIATFVIDSFSARGIVQTNNDQSQLGRLNMIVDAYSAYSLLASHPRIDPNKIILMGFSRGGQAALYASMNRFQKMHAPTGANFAAYIAFYPDCMTTYQDEKNVSDKPIRIFMGDADNYVSVDACRAYVDQLHKARKEVQFTVYPGAGHVFDARAYNKPMTLPKATTIRQCKLEEEPGGLIVNTQSGQPFTYKDSCVEYGPTLAYDAKAHEAVQKALAEFMSSLLNQK